MKKKDFTGLKAKTIKDLASLVQNKRTEAKKLKMEIAAGKSKNLKGYKSARRDIAQVLTVIREKQIIEKLEPKQEVKKEDKLKKKGGETI